MKNDQRADARENAALRPTPESLSGDADLEQQLAFITWPFFDLSESPFSSEPYHRFFFLGESTESAISSAMYAAARKKAFIVITGGEGLGKSMLCHTLLGQLDTEAHHAILVSATPREKGLVAVNEAGDRQPLATDLRKLLRRGAGKERIRIIIVDNAHNLSGFQFKELAALAQESEAEKGDTKIILVADPAIKKELGRPAHRSLAANIAVRASLKCFSREQTSEYVRHRVKVAADEDVPALFSSAALRALHFYSDGVPRRINRICSTALVEAFSRKRKRIGFPMIRKASRRLGIAKRMSRWPLAAAVLVLVTAAAIWLTSRSHRDVATPQSQGVTAQTGESNSPAPAPAANYNVDSDGIMRVDAPGDTLKASLATLFLLWEMEYLAGESLSWKIYNFNAALLGVFFQEMGISRQYGIELHAVKASINTISRLGLPCVFSYRPPGGDEGELRYAVLTGYRDGSVVVSDPLGGERELPLGSWQSDLVGPVYYLYKSARGFSSLGPGSAGTDVVLLQEELKEAGLFSGTPDGTYGPKTRRAVQKLQRIYDLEPSGVADLHARLVLLRSGKHPVPAFKY
jgi:general secretion pathway protein A